MFESKSSSALVVCGANLKRSSPEGRTRGPTLDRGRPTWCGGCARSAITAPVPLCDSAAKASGACSWASDAFDGVTCGRPWTLESS